MSENLDLVRSIFAAWERGDYSSADWADPEIEYALADGPTPGHWIGLSAMAEAMRDWLSAWEGYRSEAEAFRELDDKHVLVFLRATGGRGKTSGLELGEHGGPGGAASFSLRNGKVTRLVNYFDRDRALADLGLEDQAKPEESTTPDLEESSRRLREALSRGDLDAAVAIYAPDAAWDVSLLGLEGVFEGREAIRGAWEDLRAPYEDLEFVMEEFRDLGRGVTLVVVLARGRLRGSTGFVESRTAFVATWANGLIERNTTYLDPDHARAAAERLAEERGQGGVGKNVEIVRNVLERFMQGDVVWGLIRRSRSTTTTSSTRGNRGHAGVLRWIEDWQEGLPITSFDLQECIDAGNAVVAVILLRARARGSDVDVQRQDAIVYRLRDGTIVRFDYYNSRQQALKAVGLEA